MKSGSSSSIEIPPVEPHRTRLRTAQAAEEDAKDELFILSPRHLDILFKTSYLGHKEFSPNCNGDLLVNKKSQKIISVSLFMHCKSCKYSGPPVNMYTLLKHKIEDIASGHIRVGRQNSGPRHSTLNAALGLALTASSIDVEQWREILGGIGIDSGSENGLRDVIKAVAPINEKLAQESMDRGIQGLLDLQAKGEEVGISFDQNYNNSRPNKYHIPMQPAKQSVGTVVGSNNKTIAFYVKSKLCWHCSKLGNDLLVKGEKPRPCGRPDCTRNLDITDTISDEAPVLRMALSDLKAKGLLPQYCSLDGDAKNAKVLTEYGVDLCRDEWHLCKNIDNRYGKKPCNLNDFPGHNQAEKAKSWSEVRRMILYRCNAEFKVVSNKTKKLKGDARKKKMQNMLRCVSCAILSCHQNQCGTQCRKYSHVCDGKRSYPLFAPKPKLCINNKKIVTEMINERLKKWLPETYRRANTSINESRNRSHNRVLPKNVTCMRNINNRISRGTLSVNEGVAGSSELCNQAIGHRRSRNVKDKMNKIQETKEYRIKKAGSTDRKARQQLQVKYIKEELRVKRAKKGKVDEDVYGQGCDLFQK